MLPALVQPCPVAVDVEEREVALRAVSARRLPQPDDEGRLRELDRVDEHHVQGFGEYVRTAAIAVHGEPVLQRVRKAPGVAPLLARPGGDVPDRVGLTRGGAGARES